MKSLWPCLRTAVTVALALLVATAMIATLWWNLHGSRRFDERMREAARQVTGLELALESSLHLTRLSPFTLSLSRFRLVEPDTGGTVLAAEEATVIVRTLPLLRSRTVELESVEVVKPTLALVRRRDGSSALDSLWTGPADAGDGAGFALQRLTLRDGGASLLDEAGGRAWALEGIQLAAGPFARDKNGRVELRAHLLGLGENALKLHLHADHQRDEARGNLRLQQVKATLEGDPGRVDISTASLGWDGRRRRLEAGPMALEGRLAGAAPVRFAAAAQALRAHDGGAHIDALSAAATREADGARSELALAPAAAQWKGERLLLPQARLTARYAPGEGGLEADVRGALALSPTSRTFVASPLEAEIVLTHPRLTKPLPARLSGELRADGQDAVRGRLSGALAGERHSGELRWDGGRTPPLSLDLRLARFDADAWLKPALPARATPVDPAALQALPVHGSLRVGDLRWNGVRNRGVRLDLGGTPEAQR